MVIRAIGIVYAWGGTFFGMVGNTLLFFWAATAAIALKIIETTAHHASAEEQKERETAFGRRNGGLAEGQIFRMVGRLQGVQGECDIWIEK